MKNITFFLFFLLVCFSNLAAQSNFSGSTWYISEISFTDSTMPKQTFEIGKQLFSVTNNDTYLVENFLGITKQDGKIIESGKVLILSDGDKGYFAVFETLEKTDNSITVRYVPYRPTSNYMNLKFVKFDPNAVIPPNTHDFSGNWFFEQAGLRLELNLKQSGKSLVGQHISTETYNLQGLVEGENATITLLDASNNPIAKGNLAKSFNQSIAWGITEGLDKVKTVDGVVLKKKEEK